eukprot:12187196-Ditylum_brightwellii.AAC.1
MGEWVFLWYGHNKEKYQQWTGYAMFFPGQTWVKYQVLGHAEFSVNVLVYSSNAVHAEDSWAADVGVCGGILK